MPETGVTDVRLPLWSACLDLAAARAGRSAASVTGGLSAGPLTVFDASEGADVFTFGDPRDPSVVVFDGFLFDRREQAAALGFGARVPGDAELFAAGYARWGADAFREFEGRYLVAVWDGGSARLLLGHDALGREPAFYGSAGDRFWFASNVLTLASPDRLGATPNRLSFMRGLLQFWPEAGETYFDAIRRVRPGYYLELAASGDRGERQYWDPFPADDEPWLPDDQVLAEFEPALIKAVSRCMALDPQGIMLSGGVDSVTIAALAMKRVREEGRQPLVAVCGQTGFDKSAEELMQPRVAEALGMPFDASTLLEWRGASDDVSLSLPMMDELPSPTHIWWVGVYTRFYRRAAARGLNVLLTGSGGDNWLGVAERHAADLLGTGRFGEFVRFLRADMGTGGASMKRSLSRLGWRDGLRPHAEVLWARVAPGQKADYHRRQWQARLPAWLCPDPRDRAALVERLLETRTPPLAANGKAPRSHYRHYFKYLKNPFLHHENETAFHVDSASGLRLLSPYHDRTLVSMFNRISPRALLHGTRYKGLLRPVVAKYLPGLGLDRQRKDYDLGQAERDLQDLRRNMTAAWPPAEDRFQALGNLGVIDIKAAVAEGLNLDGKNLQGLARVFNLLSHERWLRHHGGPPAGTAGGGQN